MKFNQIVEEILSNKVSDQEKFEKDYCIIASLVHNSKSKEGKTIYNLAIECNLKDIMTDYEEKLNSFSNKTQKFLENT